MIDPLNTPPVQPQTPSVPATERGGAPAANAAKTVSTFPPIQDELLHTEVSLPGMQTYEGWQALNAAIKRDPPRLADLLSLAGSDLRQPVTHDGKTLLHWAVLHGKGKMVALLLSRGVDVDVRTKDGQTPLHFAALKGHIELFDALVERGADIHAISHDGHPTLFYAARGRSFSIIERLLSMGVNINAPVADGMTLLHRAARDGMWGVVDILVRHGADVNAATPEGFTPLWFAMQHGHTPVVDLLLRRGADEHATLKIHAPEENAKRGWLPAWLAHPWWPEASAQLIAPKRKIFLYVAVAVGMILFVLFVRGCHL